MSGGKLLNLWAINEAADEIEHIIKHNNDGTVDYYGEKKYNHYSPEVIVELTKTVLVLREAYVRAHRADYLLADDDGEESYLERLNDNLKRLGESE